MIISFFSYLVFKRRSKVASPPPSFLPKKWSTMIRSPRSSSPLICSDDREEDPIQRELRLRAEAKERLQKKFGAGGLGSQAVGSSPIPPGGYGNQPTQSSNSWNTDESPLSSPHT